MANRNVSPHRVQITTKDLWTGKRGLEVTWDYRKGFAVGFGAKPRWYWR